MEGDIDSIHLGFLHGIEAMKKATEHDMAASHRDRRRRHLSEARDRHKRQAIMQGARRDADPQHHYWRIGAWLMPCFTVLPAFPGERPLGGHAWVPVDDDEGLGLRLLLASAAAAHEQERAWFHDGTPTGIHSTMIPGTFTADAQQEQRLCRSGACATRKQPWQRITIFQDQDMAITESMGGAFRPHRRIPRQHRYRHRPCAAPADGRGARTSRKARTRRSIAKDYRLRGVSLLLPRDGAVLVRAVADAMDTRPETFLPGL